MLAVLLFAAQIEHAHHLQEMHTGDTRPGENPVLREALDVIFQGTDWKPPRHWGQTLVTFPSEGPWMLPGQVWHFACQMEVPCKYPDKGWNVHW